MQGELTRERREIAKPARRAPSLAWVAEALAFAAIVLGGLGLRWTNLGLTEFMADQAWALQRAADFLAGGGLPLVGADSSLGAPMGPVEVYLLAIPRAFSADPLVASGFLGLWQMLAVVGTYVLARCHFGRVTALVAAALFAANPWAVEYARKLWTPDPTPTFTVLLFLCLYGAVAGRRRYLFSAALLAFALLLLTHPSGAVCAPLLLIVAALFWRRIGPRPVLLGTLLAALAAAPYVYYQFA
ncbi:MAG: glycosyltransferase family 39 protein, partial [Chloroflexota bacterium]